MKITEDFIGNETKELTKTKIATILRWWGFNPDSYSTWGNARVDMNNILSGSSSSTISDRERASSFLSKINYINDTDTVISDTLFAANEPGVWYDPSDIKLDWRRNLLAYSEQFDDAAWTKWRSSIQTNVIAAPDGTLTASKLVENTQLGAHWVVLYRLNSHPNLTATVYLKAAERSRALFQLGGGASLATVQLNLGSGELGEIGVFGSAEVTAAGITPVGDGWYRVILAANGVSTGNQNLFAVYSQDENSVTSYQGDGTSGIYIWGAQLEVGSTATPYQRITDGIQDYYAVQALPVLYQDSAGTTPVTAVEQPVGLMLDKSKGLVLGPELVTNGDFSNGATGWTGGGATLSVTDGVLRVTNSGAAAGSGFQTLGTVAGVTYRLTLTRVAVMGGGVRVTVNSGTSASYTGSLQNYNTPSGGSHTLVFTASSSQSTIAFYVNSSTAGHWIGVDNISVRELPGNHAYQTTATSRPVLSARYNLLTKTQQFDDGYWNKNNVSITANIAATADPLGANTADKLIPNNGVTMGFPSSQTPLNSPVTVTKGLTYIGSIYAKKAEFDRLSLFFTDGVAGSEVVYDLNAGTVVSGAGTIRSVGDGWHLCSFSRSASANHGGAPAALSALRISAKDSVATVGDGTSGIYIWGADLRVANDGANLPPYQRVNTATDYDTAGFPHYLRFDGVDDWLVTNTITPGIDKVQVFAGVRKQSDAAHGTVVELGLDTSNTSSGSFCVLSPSSTVTVGAQDFQSRGTVFSVARGVRLAPNTNILTGLGDISGDRATLCINGVQAAQNTADQGTGNFLAYPLYIGRRGGTTFPFNGHLYSLIVRCGSNLPAATIENTEKYINGLTKAY